MFGLSRRERERDKFNNLMIKMDLKGFYLQDHKVIPNGHILYIGIPPTSNFKKFKEKEDNFKSWFQSIIELEEVKFSNTIKMKIIKEDIGAYEYEPVKCPKADKVYLGKLFDTTPYYIDLNKDAHILIAGKTGTGKSFTLATILTNIIYHYDKAYEIYLCQTAKRDIDYLKQCKPVKTTVYTPKETAAILEAALEEINNRSILFSQLGIKSIAHYNSVSKTKLKRKIYAFEEISLYMPDDTDTAEEKEDKSKVWSLIWKLVKLGRESGIHIIMLSQRTTAANLGGNGEIKSQLCRITFQQAQTIDSNNVIDCDLATTLGPQECYVLSTDGLKLVKVPTVDRGFYILNKYVPEIQVYKPTEDKPVVRPVKKPIYEEVIFQHIPVEKYVKPAPIVEVVKEEPKETPKKTRKNNKKGVKPIENS